MTKNLWHSCGQATLDDWKARMGPRARALYRGFERMIAPAKTRIAFLGRVRFAGITSVSEQGMTCGFALPRSKRSLPAGGCTGCGSPIQTSWTPSSRLG